MRLKNSAGDEVRLNHYEVCVTWFLMTGMRPKEISIFMKTHERNISYYKRTAMKKLCVTTNAQFLMWFLKNKEKFDSFNIERLLLKRGV